MGYFDSIKTKPEPRPATTTPPTPLDPARATRYAAKALNSECENVASAPEGQRNHTLNRAAFSLGQLIAAGHLDREDTWAALSVAARQNGLDDTEIDATLASGLGAGTQLPRIVPDLPPVPGVTTLTTATSSGTDDGEDIGPPLNPIIDWHELFEGEDEGEEWIIEPLLPARRMIALYSAPKAGKSLLMLEVAVGVARGTEVLGVTPERPHRVLYVDFENDPRGDIRARLEAMEVGPHQLEGLCYLTYPSLAKFDTQQGALDLLRHVQHYDCEVVVIDTLSRAVAGEENDNNTWLAFYRHTGLLLKQHGIACIRLDHSGKDAEKGMRGGSAKSGDVDAVWRLRAIGEETVVLECTDNRMLVPVKSLTLIRQEYPLTHVLVGDNWQLVADAQVREVDQLLDGLGVPTQAGERPAGKALREAGHSVNNKALREAIKLRRLRLDVPSSTAPGAAAAHPFSPEEIAPGAPPPLGGARRTSAPAPGAGKTQPSNDPDELVSCKSCFRPTTAGVADRNQGLCATCHRNSGGAA